MGVKSKEYYVETYNKFWEQCLEKSRQGLTEDVTHFTEDDVVEEATDIFEAYANAEQIAGFYILYHKDKALKDWKINTQALKFSDKDEEVDEILTALYNS